MPTDARSISNDIKIDRCGVAPIFAAGAAFAALSFAVFRPGVAMYDTVAQYRQVLTGTYDDWHPPAMARLWSVFGAHGGGPMLALQLSLYWTGLTLVAAALRRTRRTGAGVAVLAIGLWPPLLGWQAVILKDTQMLGAMVAAMGIVAWWRLRGSRLPVGAVVLVAALLSYATLVRANAVFATMPLAVGLIGWPVDRLARCTTATIAIVLMLIAAPLINHRLLGTDRSEVEKTQALYDLAGIAAATGDGLATGVPEDTIMQLRDRRCVSPFFWDPLGDETHCAEAMAPVRAQSPGRLYATLAGAIVRHPIAYAAQRLRHLNSTERWLVPYRRPDAAPPMQSEPNSEGLGTPGRKAQAWLGVAAPLSQTPLAWPVCWVVMAVTLAFCLGPLSPSRSLALALLGSALTLEASFAVLSIASDLRYHLWPMLATALAWVLSWDGARWRGRLTIGALALAVVIASGTAARLRLPEPPQTYAGMLDRG